MREISQGWYKVRIDGPEGLACVDLDKLASALPHGSGIDGDYNVTVKRNGNIDVFIDYHHMDENGYYCGWKTYKARIYRAPADKVNQLIGPCAGQTQVIHRKGDILLGIANRGETADYLYELLDSALREAGLLVPACIIESEAALKGYSNICPTCGEPQLGTHYHDGGE